MDYRNVVVITDDVISPNTTINLLESDEEMSSQERIPFLDLDPSPSPPKRSKSDDPSLRSVVMKSAIQRAPEAEDGEIVSSPELDAADLEIKIHADMTSSEESEPEETKTPVVEEIEVPVVEAVVPAEIIQILDTPEKIELITPQEEFPQKEQPTFKKRVGPIIKEDDEVEMDHLEIAAPLQKEAKKSKSKSSRDSDKTHSPKGKYSSPEKDRSSHKSRSPRDEINRKRSYDVFDERRNTSRSDTEVDERSRKSEIKRGGGDGVEDLRKHLLKKNVSSDRLIRDLDRTKDLKERGKDQQDREKERDKQRTDLKESREKDRERHGRPRQGHENKGRDSPHDINSSVEKNKMPKERHRDSPRDIDTNKTESSRKDKSRSRRTDEKSKKKKKRRHREDEQKEKVHSPSPPIEEIVLEKSPLAEESVKGELPYDDITSDSSAHSVHSSPIPQTKSATQSPSRTHSPEQSPESSPEQSLSRSPSRSPTPVRSPTPQRKRTYFPAIEGCRNVEEFTWLNRIEEGTYGVVYRAKDRRSDEVVALKRLKMEKEREGFPITSLREINTLLKSQHPNIVTVREIVVGSNMDKIYIVMDYVEHDLKALMETMTQPFLVGEVKTLMLQLLRGVRHMHDNWILHRDIKASNLLLSHKGILKIGDFGLAREYGSPLKKYTSIVVTLWYRAPELLLGTKEYSTAIDLWSVGCVFAELLTMKPLFPGKSEIDQINRIFKELGTPNDRIWPGPPAYSELPQVKKMNIAVHPYNILRQRFGATLTDRGFDLMNKLLTYDPTRRLSADDALKQEYFNEAPTPVDPSMFPTWPAKSELGHKPGKKKNASPKAPEGGGEFNLQGDDGVGFHMPTTHKGSAAKGQGFNLKF